MSRFPKPFRLIVYLSLLLALAVFYWQLGGSPALSPRRPLAQAQRRALLEPVAGENGFFFFPMEQMNQPEHRSNRRQILSILSVLSGQESASHTLAVSLRATLYDKDGQVLQTFSKHYLPQ